MKIRSRKIVLALLAYLPIFCLISALSNEEDEFVEHHTRQGFLLFISEILVSIALQVIKLVLGAIPILGYLFYNFLGAIFWGTALALSVLGIKNVLDGNLWDMPVLGIYARRMDI